MIGVGEIREMIGPMREVEREILVSVTPVVPNPLVAFDNKGVDAESL